MSKVAAVLL